MAGSAAPGCRCYVGNLPRDVTEGELGSCSACVDCVAAHAVAGTAQRADRSPRLCVRCCVLLAGEPFRRFGRVTNIWIARQPHGFAFVVRMP
jgi:hypothetical protein